MVTVKVDELKGKALAWAYHRYVFGKEPLSLADGGNMGKRVMKECGPTVQIPAELMEGK